MNKKTSDHIVKNLLETYADTGTDLVYKNNYQLLISVVLSARTTDMQVNRVTPALFEKFNSFSKLAMAETEEIEKIIKSTGFYKTKSKNIIALARMIEDKYSGEIPERREELMKLPGAGRKTANVVLSVAFGIPAFAVDTHVARIARRLNYTDSTDPVDVENSVTAIVNEKHWGRLHLAMIQHGRRICKAAHPLCGTCSLSPHCPSFGKFS